MSYYGVGFDDLNSINDFGLILCDDLKISEPKPKTKYVNVPEMDGALDLTESLTGRVSFEQREISFTLYAAMQPTGSGNTRYQPQNQTLFNQTRQRFVSAIHGKRMRIQLPTLNNGYYVGRVTVGEESGYNNGKIPVKIVADPFPVQGA